MSKRGTGGRRAAAAMVRAAEGLHVRSDRPDAARTVNIDDDAGAASASNEAEAAPRPAPHPPEAPLGAPGAAHDVPPVPASDTSVDPPGNLPLRAGRRRWDSLVSYPADQAVGESAGATDVAT